MVAELNALALNPEDKDERRTIYTDDFGYDGGDGGRATKGGGC